MVNKNIEKWLLRESFSDTDYLPDSIIWRKKEAMSDGVSSVEDPWYIIIQGYAENLYTNKQLKVKQLLYKPSPPSKEALYYRELFHSYFSDKIDHIIPHYWLPNWCGNITEPSARVLDVYDSHKNNKNGEKINHGSI